jgi:hypothetical protein
MPVDTDELQRQIDEVRVTAEDALDKFPLRSTTTPGAGKERHIHDLGKHPGGVIAARAYNSGALTITTATSTILTLDSERFDTDTIHSTSSNTGRLTAKTAGKYLIVANVRWDAAAGGRRECRIKLNGSTVIAEAEPVAVADATAVPAQNVTTIYDLAKDDYVEIEVRHTKGSNLNIRAESNFTPEFMMARIGAAGTSGGGAPGTDHGSLTGLGDDDHSLYILQAGTRALTGDWDVGAFKITTQELSTDTISEETAAAGVTIDSVLLKDGVVTVGDVAFDDATSDPLIDADAASDGAENSVARKDHVHPKHHSNASDHTQNTDSSTTAFTFEVASLTATPKFAIAGALLSTGDFTITVGPSGDLTADRAITFPDVDGEVALDSELHAAVTAADAGHTIASQAITSVAASATLTGHAELATAAETTTGTDTARVIPVVALPVQIQDNKYVFVADTASDDDYLIAPSPAIAAYATGQMFHFTAQTVNTGGATLNINGKGAKAILKEHDVALSDGDIEAGQIVTVIYDGTQFQMQSLLGNAPGGGGGGATIELDNLGTVAINTSLISDTDDTDDLGSAAKAWRATYTNLLDLQGTADALILDDDGDTTISAPTDDQIDFEVGGSDVYVIGAGTLSAGWTAIGGALGTGRLLNMRPTITGGNLILECIRMGPTYSPVDFATSMWGLRGTPLLRPDGSISVNVFGMDFGGAVDTNQLTDGESATVLDIIGALFKPNVSNFANAITKTLDVTLMKGIDIRPNIFYFEISGGSALGDCDDYIGIHLQDANTSDLVNYVGLQIDAETAASGFIYGIYQLGVGMENRLVSNLNIFGKDATPVATVDVVQDSTSGAQEVLRLQQDDIDDTFVNFVGTSAADGSRSISSDTTEDSAKFGAVRVEINGTTKWVRVYDDES